MWKKFGGEEGVLTQISLRWTVLVMPTTYKYFASAMLVLLITKKFACTVRHVFMACPGTNIPLPLPVTEAIGEGMSWTVEFWRHSWMMHGYRLTRNGTRSSVYICLLTRTTMTLEWGLHISRPVTDVFQLRSVAVRTEVIDGTQTISSDVLTGPAHKHDLSTVLLVKYLINLRTAS